MRIIGRNNPSARISGASAAAAANGNGPTMVRQAPWRGMLDHSFHPHRSTRRLATRMHEINEKPSGPYLRVTAVLVIILALVLLASARVGSAAQPVHRSPGGHHAGGSTTEWPRLRCGVFAPARFIGLRVRFGTGRATLGRVGKAATDRHFHASVAKGFRADMSRSRRTLSRFRATARGWQWATLESRFGESMSAKFCSGCQSSGLRRQFGSRNRKAVWSSGAHGEVCSPLWASSQAN